MPHLFTWVGDLLHFHPLAFLHLGRKSPTVDDGSGKAVVPARPDSRDDLAFLGMVTPTPELGLGDDLEHFAVMRDLDDDRGARAENPWMSLD
jgi:hypothetical protein